MVSSMHDIPGAHVAERTVKAHAAATTTEKSFIFVAPFACKVRSVELIWDAAITGADTNTTHVNLLNGGAAGAGTTELGNVDYVSGTDGVAGATVDLYSPDTYLSLAAGDRLVLQHEKVGTGLALPTGLVRITYEGA